jgi:amino acid adenylation domain-containing protein
LTDCTGIPKLVEAFQTHAKIAPDRPALLTDGDTASYSVLNKLSNQIARLIVRYTDGKNSPCGLFAGRSLPGFAAILASFKSGAFYAPFPDKDFSNNHQQAFDQLHPALCLADRHGLASLTKALTETSRPHVVLLLDLDQIPTEYSLPERNQVISCREIAAQLDTSMARPTAKSSLAYLMFTSGSSGKPKGVPVTHANLESYLEAFMACYPILPDDRCSQLFDLTFDLSVHDYAVTWCSGASLHVPNGGKILTVADMVRDNRITVWFSVPSVISLLHRFGQLGENHFPSLRLAAFCGESLPAELAEKFQLAGPKATVLNLYGPSEATIACTHHIYQTTDGDQVPIGVPFGGQQAIILDQADIEVPPGTVGELCLSGPQIIAGYWKNEMETARHFFDHARDGHGLQKFYRTGDLACFDTKLGLMFHGRKDDQIKLRGYRIELGAVDAVLRKATGKQVLTIPWPVDAHGYPSGLVAYCEGLVDGKRDLLKKCANLLPGYMLPRSIHSIVSLPLNANGKLDRKALLKLHQKKSDTIG